MASHRIAAHRRSRRLERYRRKLGRRARQRTRRRSQAGRDGDADDGSRRVDRREGKRRTEVDDEAGSTEKRPGRDGVGHQVRADLVGRDRPLWAASRRPQAPRTTGSTPNRCAGHLLDRGREPGYHGTDDHARDRRDGDAPVFEYGLDDRLRTRPRSCPERYGCEGSRRGGRLRRPRRRYWYCRHR